MVAARARSHRGRGCGGKRLTSLHQILDGRPPDDPDVARLWLCAVVAREFGVLPSAVARDLDEDPEQLSLLCLSLLRYAEAHAAYRRANKHELKAGRDSPMMRKVEETDAALIQREG